jgi:hypothetical protein
MVSDDSLDPNGPLRGTAYAFSSNGGATWNNFNHIEEKLLMPEAIVLEQNYPDPFNPNTEIRYSVPITDYGFVSLKVFYLPGREVARW